MNLLKKVCVAGASVLAIASVQAAPVTIQGITWDPDSTTPQDFGSNGTPAYQWFQTGSGFNPTGGTVALSATPAGIAALIGTYVTGAGVIAQINGQFANVFGPGRELTYTFGGIQITGAVVTGNSIAFTFDTTNSFFNVYSDNSLDYTQPAVTGLLADQVKAANTDQATPFLTGKFDFFGTSSAVLVPATFFNPASLSGFAGGLISVTGGAALANFDTNTAAGSDLQFTGSSQQDDGSSISKVGSIDLQGNSIPEPSTIALAGLALLGIAGAARRSRRA